MAVWTSGARWSWSGSAPKTPCQSNSPPTNDPRRSTSTTAKMRFDPSSKSGLSWWAKSLFPGKPGTAPPHPQMTEPRAAAAEMSGDDPNVIDPSAVDPNVVEPSVVDKASRVDLILSALAVTAIAIAQPILDLLGRTPEFFTARAAPTVDVVMLGVVLGIALPLLVAGIVLLADVISHRVG